MMFWKEDPVHNEHAQIIHGTIPVCLGKNHADCDDSATSRMLCCFISGWFVLRIDNNAMVRLVWNPRVRLDSCGYPNSICTTTKRNKNMACTNHSRHYPGLLCEKHADCDDSPTSRMGFLWAYGTHGCDHMDTQIHACHMYNDKAQREHGM